MGSLCEWTDFSHDNIDKDIVYFGCINQKPWINNSARQCKARYGGGGAIIDRVKFYLFAERFQFLGGVDGVRGQDVIVDSSQGDDS